MDDTGLTLPGTLSRDAYTAVNKFLELAGAKWNRKAKRHEFQREAKAKIERLFEEGGLIDEKKHFQAFYTPRDVAVDLVTVAGVIPGMMCMEPSAGEGVLAEAMREAGGEVVCIELNPESAEKVRAKGFETVAADFLTVESEAKYDRVVMNPPFTRDQDIDHVLHALRFLKPGGKVVAIVGKGFTFGENKKRAGFRQTFSDCGVIVKELPSGTFKDSGTMVATLVIELTCHKV